MHYSAVGQDKITVSMEFGESLENRMKQKVEEKTAIKILKDITSGIKFFHEYEDSGMEILCLKPSNVILVNDVAKIEFLGYQNSIISDYTAPELKTG